MVAGSNGSGTVPVCKLQPVFSLCLIYLQGAPPFLLPTFETPPLNVLLGGGSLNYIRTLPTYIFSEHAHTQNIIRHSPYTSHTQHTHTRALHMINRMAPSRPTAIISSSSSSSGTLEWASHAFSCGSLMTRTLKATSLPLGLISKSEPLSWMEKRSSSRLYVKVSYVCRT